MTQFIIILGYLSLLVALVTIFSGDPCTAAVCLLAAGASLGLLANAVLRG